LFCELQRYKKIYRSASSYTGCQDKSGRGCNAKKSTKEKAEFEAIVRPNLTLFLFGFRPKLFIYKMPVLQKSKRISLLVKKQSGSFLSITVK
jgi:hypothetical protein